MYLSYFQNMSRLFLTSMGIKMTSQNLLYLCTPYLRVALVGYASMRSYPTMTYCFEKMKSYAPKSKQVIMKIYNQRYLGIINQVQMADMARKFIRMQNYPTNTVQSSLSKMIEMFKNYQILSSTKEPAKTISYKLAPATNTESEVELNHLRALRKEAVKNI